MEQEKEKPEEVCRTQKLHGASMPWELKPERRDGPISLSFKEGPYLDQNLMKKILNMKAGDRTVVKTWARDATITPEMVGFTFGVHNGKDFIPVTASEEMVGHRLGDFPPC